MWTPCASIVVADNFVRGEDARIADDHSGHRDSAKRREKGSRPTYDAEGGHTPQSYRVEGGHVLHSYRVGGGDIHSYRVEGDSLW